jgi:hypothetical protein
VGHDRVLATPAGPEPVTRERSTPSSFASIRAAGRVERRDVEAVAGDATA